jgi:hypothetical protein
VANLPPRRSRRIQGLLPEEEIRNNSPRLLKGVDLISQDTFVPVGQSEIVDHNSLEVNVLELEEVIVEDLGAEEFTPHANSPLPLNFPI